MTPEATPAARTGSSLYFAFIGFLSAIILIGVHLADAVPGASPADLYLIREYALVGLAAIGYVFFSFFGDTLRTRAHVPVWLYESPVVLWCAILAWATWYLLSGEHNRFFLIIALIEALAVRVLVGYRTWGGLAALLAVAILSWSFSATIPFTPLKDWLVGASPGTSLSVVSFVASYFVVLVAFADSRIEALRNNLRRMASYAFALAIFLEASLRTDHLLNDWVPYHRAYFADVANLVRTGHWLLWDVPSQYGFLAVLAIAITPGPNAWQSLYILTAFLLLIEASVTFTILYYGRRSWSSYALALLLPLAAYFNGGITRFPFDGRLYPQGGIRFVWTVLLILIAFWMYVKRDRVKTVGVLRIAGYAIWTISLLWSFETGIWATIVWLANVGAESIVETLKRENPSVTIAVRLICSRLWPFVAIPIAILLSLEAIYHIALRHGPDLMSYLEFTAIYAADPNFHITVDRHGPAWTLLLILGALGALGVLAVRTRRLDSLPLISTAWMATWITASYWVGEAFNNHVIATYAVAIPSAAVAIFLSREAFASNGAALIARLSLAPMAIIMIALLFGEPARMMTIRAPFIPGWNFDSTRQFPAISGELADLVNRAGIRPSDPVIFPTSVGWIKLDLGFILPFVRMPDGSLAEYQSWLPLGPQGVYNSLESLPLDRQQLYIDRNLDEFRGTGWYITYREPGRCALISQRLMTIRSVKSTNFEASLCQLKHLMIPR